MRKKKMSGFVHMDEFVSMIVEKPLRATARPFYVLWNNGKFLCRDDRDKPCFTDQMKNAFTGRMPRKLRDSIIKGAHLAGVDVETYFAAGAMVCRVSPPNGSFFNPIPRDTQAPPGSAETVYHVRVSAVENVVTEWACDEDLIARNRYRIEEDKRRKGAKLPIGAIPPNASLWVQSCG